MISGNKKLNILHLTAWGEPCGIADYARDMVNALNTHGLLNEIYPIKNEFFDPMSQSMMSFYARASLADVIHIQHEFLFFSDKNIKHSIGNFHHVLKKLKKLQKPIVVSFHTNIKFLYPDFYQPTSAKDFIQNLGCWVLSKYWKNKISRFFKKHTNFQAIVHTKETRSTFIHSGFSPEKVDLIPLGILPRNALISMDKPLAKEKLNYPKDCILLSIFGFVINNKGHEFAIKALKLLPPHYHLAIVGGPNPKSKKLILDEVLQLVYENPEIKNRVRVTGYVDTETRDLYHAATDICLAPYKETYGNASGSAGIGWALSSGNPIIASRIATFNEINQEADCFLMCAQKSVFELAWLIEYLMADNNLQTKLVKNALKYAANNQWSNVVHQIINSYRKCLGDLVDCNIKLSNAVGYNMMVEAAAFDPVSQECKKGTPYQQEAVELMLQLVKPNSKILDVGAHIGTFSLAAAANDCQVLAIEASPFHAQLIKSSAKNNQFDQLHVFNAAVSDVPGSLEFHVNGPWGGVVMPEDNSSHEGTIVKVQALPIRDVLKELEWSMVDFIKMDIEGYEIAALTSMSELLQDPKAPPIFYESNSVGLERYGQTPQKLKALLEGFGYQNYLFDRGRLAPVKVEDFQTNPCVDYLAIKQPIEVLSQYIRPPLSEVEMIQRVVNMCSHPLASQRAVLAKALRQADEWIVNNARVKRALDRLKVDRDSDVREQAAWWNPQSV